MRTRVSSRRLAFGGTGNFQLKLQIPYEKLDVAKIQEPFLPRCMECRRGLAMRIMFVRMSVCLHARLSNALILTKRKKNLSRFLANVNSSSCSLFVIGRPSVCLSSVCNVGAPYSGDWNFRQYFYAMWYLGHPPSLYKNFTEIVRGEPLRWGS